MSAIGIDLGTTYSCVAVVVNGEVKILPNRKRNYTTPSCVAVTDQSEVVGEEAKANLLVKPANTFYNVKRIIGRSYEDPTLQEVTRTMPFTVKDKIGNVHLTAVTHVGKLTYTPEEISGFVLGRMREIAEDYLEKKITNAVITIPARFNNAQRSATKIAAEYAGLHVLRLLTEPTAAAIAYGFQKKSADKRNLLVFDFGGGTLDVSVLTAEQETFEVKGTSGSTHLGGEDFDNRMVNKCIQEFAQSKRVDLKNNQLAKNILRAECEKAKKVLSTKMRASVEVELLHEDMDFSTTFTRVQFERMNEDLFDEAIGYVSEALKGAEMEKETIDKIILAGGSSRIPRIQAMLSEYFGKEVCNTINADEAIAYGAAIEAAFQTGDASLEMANLRLYETTPLSLGIETKGGVMSVIIPLNTGIPVKKERNYTTCDDYQTSLQFNIFEGERAKTRLNHFLNGFVLEDIPRALAGKVDVTVHFTLDESGILQVSAHEMSTGKEEKISINWSNISGAAGDVDSKINDAKNSKSDDEDWKRVIHARNKLEGSARKLMRLAEGDSSTGSSNIGKRCSEILSWIEQHEDLSADELNAKNTELAEAFLDSQR